MPGDFEDLYDLDNMDDEEIEALILEELGEYPDLDPDLVEVTVEDGFVVLTGRIGTEQELQEIEYVLSDVLGIANYSNELAIDEVTRGEYNAGADDAVVEDAEVEAQLGEEGKVTEPTADHLMEDVETELYGTHNMQRAIDRGTAYEPPDRPIPDGFWSEENH